MAYDDSQLRRDADVTDPLGQQPPFGGDFRDSSDLTRSVHHSPGLSTGYQDVTSNQVSPAMLDDVFDDLSDGTPGRDRMGVHWAWELLLLLGVGILFVLLWQADAAAVRGDALAGLLITAAGFGLLGMATGLSLRAAAPNLAIGPVAAAAAVYFADRGAEGVMAPTGLAVVAAAGLGAALAVLVVGLHVPGWAASLAAAAGVVVWLHQQPAEVPLSGNFDPTGRAFVILVAVAGAGILGGLLGALRPVRRALGRFRPVGDPAARRGPLAALVTSVALVLSMVFAVAAGVIIAAGQGGPVQGSAGTGWLEFTVVGLAVALVGGTSAFGRRGGVFGTSLAALLFVLFDRYQESQGWGIALLATGAAAVAGGLLITRLVERFGRPFSEDEDPWSDDQPAPQPETAAAPTSDAWSAADAWTSALPAQPAPENPWRDRWSR
jgi:hypothetical protein